MFVATLKSLLIEFKAYQFIVKFLQEHLDGSGASFEQMFAPIAEDFRASGMTEEDLDALVDQERQAIWDEKRS